MSRFASFAPRRAAARGGWLAKAMRLSLKNFPGDVRLGPACMKRRRVDKILVRPAGMPAGHRAAGPRGRRGSISHAPLIKWKACRAPCSATRSPARPLFGARSIAGCVHKLPSQGARARAWNRRNSCTSEHAQGVRWKFHQDPRDRAPSLHINKTMWTLCKMG